MALPTQAYVSIAMTIFPRKAFFSIATAFLILIAIMGPIFKSMVQANHFTAAYMLNLVVSIAFIGFLTWVATLWSKSPEFKMLFMKPGYKLLGKLYFFLIACIYNLNTNKLSPSPPPKIPGTGDYALAVLEAGMACLFFVLTLLLAKLIDQIEQRMKTGFLQILHASVIGYGFSVTLNIPKAFEPITVHFPSYLVHIPALMACVFVLFWRQVWDMKKMGDARPSYNYSGGPVEVIQEA